MKIVSNLELVAKALKTDGLKPMERLIYAFIALKSNEHKEYHEGLKKIGEYLSLEYKTIFYSTKSLKNKGLLTIQKRKNEENRYTNCYILI